MSVEGEQTPLAPPRADIPAVPASAVAARRRLSDGPIEIIVSWLLRVGVWASIVTIVAGLVMLVVTDHTALTRAHAGGLNGLLKDGLSGQPASISSYGDALLSLRHGQSFGVIMVGLMILLATPVLRVAVSIVAFAIEGDRLYTWITIVVLSLLFVGILLGRGGG
jgi:uncharacterized membrane protein